MGNPTLRVMSSPADYPLYILVNLPRMSSTLVLSARSADVDAVVKLVIDGFESN